MFAGNSLPQWMQDMAINEMSHFRGLIWTQNGRLREFEANDCPDVDSQHNDYQRHLPCACRWEGGWVVGSVGCRLLRVPNVPSGVLCFASQLVFLYLVTCVTLLSLAVVCGCV